MDEMDGDANFNLLLSALVTAAGFWLVYKFGSQKLREMSLATDRAMPNREDPLLQQWMASRKQCQNGL